MLVLVLVLVLVLMLVLVLVLVLVLLMLVLVLLVVVLLLLVVVVVLLLLLLLLKGIMWCMTRMVSRSRLGQGQTRVWRRMTWARATSSASWRDLLPHVWCSSIYLDASATRSPSIAFGPSKPLHPLKPPPRRPPFPLPLPPPLRAPRLGVRPWRLRPVWARQTRLL